MKTVSPSYDWKSERRNAVLSPSDPDHESAPNRDSERPRSSSQVCAAVAPETAFGQAAAGRARLRVR